MSLARSASGPGGLSINTGAANSLAPPTTQSSAGGGLFGSSSGALSANAANQPAAAATTMTTTGGGMFGGGQQKTGTGLFGSSTTPAATGGGGLFGGGANTQTTTTGASTGGGLFGGANTQQNQGNTSGPVTGGGLFGAQGATAQQQQQQPQQQQQQQQQTGGGLFGNVQNPQQQMSSGLFGTPAAKQPRTLTLETSQQGQQQQQQPQQQQATGGLFGSLARPQQTQQATSGLFGQSTQNQPQQTSGGMFGQQQPKPMGSVFGASQPQQQNQPSQQPGSVSAVRINFDNLRPRSRFDDLAQEVQEAVFQIDQHIQRVIHMKAEISEFMPQHERDIAQLGRDVNFVESKFKTVQAALNRDVQTVKALQDMTKKNLADSALSRSAVDNLQLPMHYHQTGLFATPSSVGQSGGAGGGASASQASAQDLISYFNRICDDIDRHKHRLDEYRGAIERDMPGVENGLYEQIRALRERQRGGGGGGGAGGLAMQDQLGEILAALRDTGTAIVAQAGLIAETRERLSKLQAGIVDSGVYAMGLGV